MLTPVRAVNPLDAQGTQYRGGGANSCVAISLVLYRFIDLEP